LYAEAALAELDDAGVHAESWRRLLDHVDNDADRLVRLIAGMLAKREQWLRHLVTDDRAALRTSLERTLAAEIDAVISALDALLPPRYDDAAWSFVEALLDVLPRAAARLSLVFAQRGMIDFTEATLITLRALEGEEGASEFLLSLDARIEHLLVDEFQDTSLA